MHKVKNKLRVCHYPQIPCSPFCVDVRNEEEAFLIENVLVNQHIFLFDHNIIPDYSNVVSIEMWDDIDGEGHFGWTDYYNEKEFMDWEEFCSTYSNHLR